MSSKKSTAVSVNITQDNIPTMLEDVKNKIANLTMNTDENRPTTAGTIFPDGSGLHISDMHDVNTLITVHASIAIREKAYNASVKKLGLTITPPAFNIAGHSAKLWEDDIKIQLMKVIHAKKIASLNKIKNLLEERQTEEQKLATSLSQISDLMEEADKY